MKKLTDQFNITTEESDFIMSALINLDRQDPNGCESLKLQHPSVFKNAQMRRGDDHTERD